MQAMHGLHEGVGVSRIEESPLAQELIEIGADDENLGLQRPDAVEDEIVDRLTALRAGFARADDDMLHERRAIGGGERDQIGASAQKLR